VDTLASSPPSAGPATQAARVCVFCQEEIRPGASVCPHCGSNLAPLQSLADRNAALEARLAALEQEVILLRDPGVRPAGAPAPAAVFDGPAPMAARSMVLMWPHMVDNLLLGLATLLAAHWIATTFPVGDRAMFRIVALAVALPFGFRFETNARAGTSGRVFAALAFASIGTLLIGIVDLLVPGRWLPPALLQDAVASFATIALSHFAGSAFARFRQIRNQRRAAAASAQSSAAPVASSAGASVHLGPAQIKTTAETIKALYDAGAPLVAGGAALWAAVGHTFF
jgi:hypothetical protein